jgi:hypothetical protein
MDLIGFNTHGPSVTTPRGVVYHFRTIEAAERFKARIGANLPAWQRLRTPASAVHQRAYRLGPLPTCIVRATLKQGLTVERTPPPDRNRPSPALRIVEEQAA